MNRNFDYFRTATLWNKKIHQIYKVVIKMCRSSLLLGSASVRSFLLVINLIDSFNIKKVDSLRFSLLNSLTYWYVIDGESKIFMGIMNYEK